MEIIVYFYEYKMRNTIRKFFGEMFPSRVELMVGGIAMGFDNFNSIQHFDEVQKEYKELPYTTRRTIFRHTKPNIQFWESHLAALSVPVYHNTTAGYLVEKLAKDLIWAAHGIGTHDPDQDNIIIEVEGVKTGVPEYFDIFFNSYGKNYNRRYGSCAASIDRN